MLNLEEQKELLILARKTLETYLRKQILLEYSTNNKNLLQRAGAFVTLNKDNMLRGCIGNFFTHDPLYKNVQMMAISAAVQDPRFRRVTVDELDKITIEISVLSELEPINSVDEIEVGKHGLYVTKGFYRGVLLPQVATEYGWDKYTFLSETCIKAGLPADEWKKGEVKIEKFTAQVFSEEEVFNKN